MADSETVDTAQQVVDTTQQVTSKTPATKQKNPKRVAAGKAIAQTTKMAREAQKKALIEAQSVIANNQLKQAEPPAVAPPVADTLPAEHAKITTTQWLSVISIVVSLAGIYCKREEIKSAFTKPPPSPVLPRAPRQLLLMLRQKEKGASKRWIENQLNFSQCFYNNG